MYLLYTCFLLSVTLSLSFSESEKIIRAERSKFFSHNVSVVPQNLRSEGSPSMVYLCLFILECGTYSSSCLWLLLVSSILFFPLLLASRIDFTFVGSSSEEPTSLQVASGIYTDMNCGDFYYNTRQIYDLQPLGNSTYRGTTTYAYLTVSELALSEFVCTPPILANIEYNVMYVFLL